MGELHKKISPENYRPVKPEIIHMAEIADDNKVNGVEIPFLFKKQIIHLSDSLLIGRKVTYPIAAQGIPEEEGGNPPLSLLWDRCTNDGTFDYLQGQKDTLQMDAFMGLYADINVNNDGQFSYIVGALMKTDAEVPAGFAACEVPASDVAVCWYQYRDDDDIWSVAHNTVEKYMDEQGYEGLPENGWCSELYPFDMPNPDDGYHILGYLIACRKKED